MRGAPGRAIRELAGHQDLMTTQRSMHLTPGAIEGAIRLLEQPIPQGVEKSWRSLNRESLTPCPSVAWVAGSTGLEPAASGVTGRRSNQLNYDPKQVIRLKPDTTTTCDGPTEWAVQDSNL
jgi:hypothetical protein